MLALYRYFLSKYIKYNYFGKKKIINNIDKSIFFIYYFIYILDSTSNIYYIFIKLIKYILFNICNSYNL